MRRLLVIFVVAMAIGIASVAAVGKGWKWGAPPVKNGASPYDGWTWDEMRSDGG